jgi:2-dehydro-3-deoxyphosphooctonate aldolase (KDO 8-P synthase)
MFYGNWDGFVASDLQLSPNKLTVIAGPCMLESLELGLRTGLFLKNLCLELGIQYIFKASFDKANRTSKDGIRGPGFEKGLQWLQVIRSELGVPVLTDVHNEEQVIPVAKVCDVLQVPAFLCIERTLLEAVARSGKVVQVKKGQHLPVEEVIAVAKAIVALGNSKVMLCERGSCFGYNNLVVDYRNLFEMTEAGFATVFDGTHSVQLPGAAGGSSSGLRHVVPALVRAAVGVGVDALFLEVHENPVEALSDRDTQLDFALARKIITEAQAIHVSRR